jgi:hypothetical protein
MTKYIVPGLLSALAVVGGALLLKYLQSTGLAPTDSAERGTMVLIGLLLAVNSNLIPKEAAPSSARVLSLSRLAGWGFTLGGLGFAAVWAFAPRESAALASIAAVAVPLILVLAACLLFRIAPAD